MTQAPKPARLLSTQQVADMFRVDPRTVRRWVRTGKLRALKAEGIGRGYFLRFREADVHALFTWSAS